MIKTQLAGYRLHDKRIGFTGGSGSMRSIKYELVGQNKDTIFDAIKHDNLKLYGALNFNDYLSNKNEPNLLDFWLLSLSKGFFFSTQSDIVRQANDFFGNATNESKLFNSIDLNVRKFIDEEKWIAFYTNNQRNLQKKTVDQRKDIIELILINKSEVSSELTSLMEQWIYAIDEVGFNNQVTKKRIFNILEADVDDDSDNKKQTIKIGVAFNPNIEEASIENRTKFLDDLIKYFEERTTQPLAKRFIGVGDNGNYFNEVFGQFFSKLASGRSADLDELVDYFDNNFHQNKKEVILEKLTALSQYAQKIGSPYLVSSWADYRSDFNGTIESWYSNRGAKINTTLEQIFGRTVDKETGEIVEIKNDKGETVSFVKLVSDILDALKVFKGITGIEKTNQLNKKKSYSEDEQEKDRDALIFQGKKILEFIGNDFTRNVDRSFTDELESYLSVWKSDLNEFDLSFATTSKGGKRNYPSHTPGSPVKKDSERFPDNWQKQLSKHIQSSPLFFGENKRQLWQQLLTLKKDIREQVQIIKDILETVYSAELFNITPKQIDSLAILYNRIKGNGSEDVIKALENIANQLDLDFSKRTESKRFYVNSYSRRNVIDLLDGKVPTYVNTTFLQDSNIKELLDKLVDSPQADFLLRDVTQLSKIVVSAQLVNESPDTQRKIVLAHSNLQGYASLISKQNIISRYPLQAVGSNGNKNNQFIGGGVSTLGIDKNNKFVYAFKKLEGENLVKTQLSKVLSAKDNSENVEEDFVESPNDAQYVSLNVQSSKYQLQFLNQFIGKLDNSRNTRLKYANGFTIGEEEVSIDWSAEQPQIISKQNRKLNKKTRQFETDNGKRVFISQPFTLQPIGRKGEIDKNRFIGVDIGEYGLAWTLIEAQGNYQIDQELPDDHSVYAKRLKSGFLADPQQQTIKQKVKSLRENQVRQTFTSPDTKIARVRESAIGRYTNLLSELSMKYKARLSFESSVSAFETGSNRVSKIYDSVKRAFVKKGGGQTVSNEAQNQQAWGKLTKETFFNQGFETTAAGTSQFSTAVNHPNNSPRWASLDFENKSKKTNYTLEEYQDGLFKVKLNSGNYVRVYVKNGHIDDAIFGEDLGGAVYKAMRPNIFESDNETEFGGILEVKRQLGSEKFEELKTKFGPGQKRGNIGIYVDPYIDSLHISDADVQASYNIAIRGFLKSINPIRAKKTGGLSAEFLTNEEQKMKLDQIELDLSLID